VVIAIIGLLASIVIVNLTGTRSKASIARGLQFSQSIHHALGAYAVGVWSFDEGSGTIANDASGYGNNGTINGASYMTDTPSNTGYALSFDGTTNYISFSYVRNIGNEITVSAWIEPKTISGTHEISNQGQWDGGPWTGWRFRQINNQINFKLGNNTSTPYELSAGSIKNDVWHHVVGIWDGNYISIYVNGINVGKTPKSFIYSGNTASYWIGKYPGPAYYFNGLIDEVRIYEKALETAQVEALYYAGLDNLLARGLIEEEEYQKRLALK